MVPPAGVRVREEANVLLSRLTSYPAGALMLMFPVRFAPDTV
jgi:hypothetical protein